MTDDAIVIGSNGKAHIIKDPDAVLDYVWDWTDWLGGIGDTISSKSFILDTGLTLVSSQIVDGNVIGFISGGTDGNDYNAVCRIVTTGGRTDDRTLTLKVRQT